MNGFVRTASARRDLDTIDNDVGAESPAAADRLLASFQAVFQFLAGAPRAGQARPELAPGVRSFPFGSHLVFYRQAGDRIEILRALHAWRDINRAFRVP